MIAMLLFLMAFGIGFYALLGTLVVVGVKGYLKTLAKAFCFWGRTERREFWGSLIAYLVLVMVLGYIVLLTVGEGMFQENAEQIYSVLAAAFLLSLFPWLTAQIRRMHDVGVPAAVGCIVVFPQLFCWVVLAFLYLSMKNSYIMALVESLEGILAVFLKDVSYETGDKLVNIFKTVMMLSFGLSFFIALLPSGAPSEDVTSYLGEEEIA